MSCHKIIEKGDTVGTVRTSKGIAVVSLNGLIYVTSMGSHWSHLPIGLYSEELMHTMYLAYQQ